MAYLDVLFIHTNFPAQFRGLAEHLQGLPNVRVKAISSRTAGSLPGVEIQRYSFDPGTSSTVHAFARRFEQECRRAEQIIYAANILKLRGFSPHIIYVHPGWGEALPLRALFPDAVIIAYAEFYYRPRGTDVGFDQEFGQFGIDGETRVTLRNASNLLALAEADLAIAPTHWQRSVFPLEFQHKIDVIHDGIDTDALTPLGRAEGRREEIVTFVARNLEPYRGFHMFMRALGKILRARPKAQIYIVGGDKVSYGNPPRHHDNWREAMLDEVGGSLDMSRVHFTGPLAYDVYVSLLRRSQAHVYLTYPFVLSWSMLEAMSLGCLVVGSDTGPVTEVIEDGANGYLVPFADPSAIADRIIETLAQPSRQEALRRAARDTVVERYDQRRVALPAHEEVINRLLALRSPRASLSPRRDEALHRVLVDTLRAG